MTDNKKTQKDGFWGKPIKDEQGHVVAYRDEFGDVRTPQEILKEVSCCMAVLITIAGTIAGCTMRVHEEIKKHREKKAEIQKVEPQQVQLLRQKIFTK